MRSRPKARSGSSSSFIADSERCDAARPGVGARAGRRIISADISNRTRLEWRRRYAGPYFLSEGFRPLFLLSGLWATLSVPLWLGVWTGEIPYSGLFTPAAWHVHEMVFGYVGAALAGFVLTAVPNWTGRLPVRGIPLALMALAWISGRAAVWWSAETGPVPAALADLAFLSALAALVANEIVAGRNWRNLPVLAGLVAMVAANALFHVSATGPAGLGDSARRLSIAVIAMLLALIGGRVVPSFTRNWFAKHSGPRIATPMDRFDRAALAATALALAIWAAAGSSVVCGVLLSISGTLNLARLARWRGWNAAAEPLVTVLHAGYLWLALGLGLLGLSMLSDRIPEPLALHVLSIGAFGTMTLAVMTRTVLGHTGRVLRAGPSTVAIYGLATLAVLARAMFEIVPDTILLWAAGASWSLAFALFTGIYAPMLLRPRKV